MEKTPPLIVFYDGQCGFCNRVVLHVLRNNKDHSIYFASLQSAYTKELFLKNGWPEADLSTFYFFENGKLYNKSTAAIRLGKYLTLPHKLSFVFIVVPVKWRDAIYNWIAVRRRRLFQEYCFRPDESQRRRFLD